MTTCEICQAAEASITARWLGRVIDIVAPAPSPVARMMAGYADLLAATVGAAPRSWYDKHREAYARTGNEIELTRMLRHVEAP